MSTDNPTGGAPGSASMNGTLLEGKVILVSGLGDNLGRAIALAAAAHGADLVVSARRARRLEAVADEVRALGRQAWTVTCDVTSAEACAQLAGYITDEVGRLDGLVNNAFTEGDWSRFADADLDGAWRAPFEVNFWGSLRVTQALLPLLGDAGDARVVMVNTMATQRIQERFGSYAASKGALATVTRTLAVELGGQGIRVNGVHPGYIYGDAVEWYVGHLAERDGVSFDDKYAELASETALGYLPPAAEVADAVLFFLSPLARCITGQSLGVNAGHHLT
ncbi:MAG: SDR family oxidoreductase [Acidimicrobiia bacterium]|nr:SDR family oxidoreductase [Acidimicrobiia bacterium]